jgi:hypothetical protein
MAIRDDLEHEAGPAGGRGGLPEGTEERSATSRGGGKAEPLEGFHKCPYLAGRPPCGTHHLFPSGTNVCWASPGEEKPYRGIRHETQESRCFGGPEGQAGCERYQQAVARALPLPRFEPPRADNASRPNWIVPPDRRPRHRRDDKARARLIFILSWSAPLVFALLLLALLFR